MRVSVHNIDGHPVDQENLLFLGLLLCPALLDVFARHARPEDGVPVDEERLREVGLDTDHLSSGEACQSGRICNSGNWQ